MRKSLYRRHNQVFLDLLRGYREQGKFRQRDLALHLGSVQGTVSKAETGNRRLDVIELREWLLAMGVDFLEFMTELHEQLESLNHTGPWVISRLPFTKQHSAHTPNVGHMSQATQLAVLIAELDRLRVKLQPIRDYAAHESKLSRDSSQEQIVAALNTYLTERWVPELLRDWQAYWSSG